MKDYLSLNEEVVASRATLDTNEEQRAKNRG